ncbi:hypothetical protein [Wenyingzhuangia sp. IMCC45467]
MKLKFIVFLLLTCLCKLYANSNPEIQFKTSKTEFLHELEKIWESSEITINSEKKEINSNIKFFIVITVNSNLNISEEKFSKLINTTSSLVFKNIVNTKDFRVAKVDFINNETDFKKSENLYVIIDEQPIIEGSYENCENPNSKQCFYKKLSEHIVENFNLSNFNNIGLEKKKYRIITNFTVNKNGGISDIIVNHENEIVINEITNLLKSLKIEKSGFNDGIAVDVKFAIPFSFIIE